MAAEVPDGRYANAFDVGCNAFEFLIDAGHRQGSSNDVTVHARIVTSPACARLLCRTLSESLAQYDATYAENERRALLASARDGRSRRWHPAHIQRLAPATLMVAALAVAAMLAAGWWVRHAGEAAANPPSEADTRLVFEHQRDDLDRGRGDLVAFKNVGAKFQDVLGVRLYLAEYEAQVRDPATGRTEAHTGRITFKMTDRGWLGEDGRFY